jgi:hypothetical protein
VGIRDLWRKYVALDERSGGTYPYSLTQWTNDVLTYQGLGYPLSGGSLVGNEEKIESDFRGLTAGAYKHNAVVFACMAVRMRVFTEARFQWREINKGRPGNLFGTQELRILEEPWPGGTTGDLLARMLQDADLGGNSFILRVSANRLMRLRPDWITIVSGSTNGDIDAWDIGAEVIGYLYQPGGPGGGRTPIPLLPETVAHFAPVPDPIAPWRGMSWLTPIIREVQADGAATMHKQTLFQKGATPNMIVKADATVTRELFDATVKLVKEGHEGAANAYKTLFLAGGWDAQVVGSNLRQLDFKATQGAGETRIAAAAGVPAVLVGLSEGLASATYSNYGMARRAFADMWARPTWRNAAGSLERIVNTPSTNSGKAELWYDDRDISFLQDDHKDTAEIQVAQSSAIRQLVDAGFKPDTVVDAVLTEDLSKLRHEGLFSVQLMPPGTVAPATNGKVPVPTPAE